ncbi:MAG: hypothetical protein O2958_15075 [Gemmatimonadetes bacterium]|nr:hypothetical protein [Gemmatimonadota bacterium]MDA1104540.1 hypothetical protein [Gemmatimonadota bacterium]
MTITLWDDEAIEPGTFTGFTAAGTSVGGVTLSYENATGTECTAEPVDASITLNDVTATHLRGSLSAVVSGVGVSDVTITEGQFSVRRVN